jgi:hypothetical protein
MYLDISTCSAGKWSINVTIPWFLPPFSFSLSLPLSPPERVITA